MIIPASRYGINFDASVALIAQMQVDELQITDLNNAAIFASGTGAGNGVLRASTIQNSFFYAGVVCHSCGDTFRFINNQIQGSQLGLSIDNIDGSSDNLIYGNNISTAAGGIYLGAYVRNTQVINNEIETYASSVTAPDNALIDVDGGSGAGQNGESITIAGNTCQIVNGSPLNCLRINYPANTNVYDNRFGRGAAGSTDITITAHAVGTTIGTNKWLEGTPYSQMLSDAGTGTSILAMYNGHAVTRLDGTYLSPVSGTAGAIAEFASDGSVTSGPALAELVQFAHSCNGDNACTNTANGSNRIVFGYVSLVGGTATVTGINPAFTSAGSFMCQATDNSTVAAAKIAYASPSSITITGTGTDIVTYFCIGN
jgi:hypothetical protein